MAHVGGEALDRVHPLMQRVRHLAQHAGQLADLVAALGEPEVVAALRTIAAPDALRRRGEPQHRLRDGLREVKRQQNGRQHRAGEDAEHGETDGADGGLDLHAVLRQQQHADDLPVALHRDGDGENVAAGSARAHDADDLAGEGPLDFRVVLGALVRTLRIGLQLLAVGQPADRDVDRVDQPVEQPVGFARRRQLLHLHDPAAAEQPAAVRDHVARVEEQARADSRRRAQPAHDMARRLEVDELPAGGRDLDGALADRARDHLALAAQRFEIAVDQAVAIRPDIQQAADRDQQRDDVHGENAARQRRHHPPRRSGRRPRLRLPFLVLLRRGRLRRARGAALAILHAAHREACHHARTEETLADRAQRSLMLHAGTVSG